MTEYGGPEHFGSIFHYIPSNNTITIDYNFQTKVHGVAPKCELVSSGTGKYFGTTSQGGAYDAGLIFSWDSLTSEYLEPHDFTGADGKDPRGVMVLYNGKLYGLTNAGGANDFGTIYEWDFTTNTLIDKVDMDGINGKNPNGSLTLFGNTFYGFTNTGGLYDKGVLFSWDPATNIYTKKFDFDSINGSNPVGKLSEFGGKFYAMTSIGGQYNLGVIYEWDPVTNIIVKKFDFDGINGSTPLGYLTLYNNNFYGLTFEGGIYETPSILDHFGIIFEWNPQTNLFTKKIDLGFGATGSHGIGPKGSLTLLGNIFWGTTTEGIDSRGSIFSWDPATNTYTDQFRNYPTPPNDRSPCEENLNPVGSDHNCALTASGNKLLGAAADAGGFHAGCIFEYFPDSNQVLRAVHMKATDGKFPRGSLTKVGNKLYGMTPYGGNNHDGNIFEWDLATDQFTEKIQFDGYHNGIQPQGSLTFLNGEFYGILPYGKLRSSGVWASYGIRDYSEIFSWNPATNLLSTRMNYNAQGVTLSPASFTAFNSKLYTTRFGGFLDTLTNTQCYGAIVEFDPVQNTAVEKGLITEGAFLNLQDKISANSVTAYNGKLYGLTSGKWPGSMKGTIYEWDPSLTLTTNKVSLSDTTGTYPVGDLALADSTFFGLTTGYGGGIGSLFEWNPNTNAIEVKAQSGGGNATPVFSEGKIYYVVGNIAPTLVAYDPLTDSVVYNYLPTFPGQPTPYAWFNFNCEDYSYMKLVEVIPNQNPFITTAPANQILCASQSGSVDFMMTDADNDTLSFQVQSSDSFLVPVSTISILSNGSNYTIHYSNAGNTAGSSTISIHAIDGYGGSADFSFLITVLSSPSNTVTQNNTTLSAQQNGATYQWLDCTDNFTIVPGANAQQFTPTISGNYAAMITLGNCTDTSQCILVNVIGIEELNQDQDISFFPNPVDEEIRIESSVTPIQISIQTITGEEIISESKKEINVSALASGIYFLLVRTNNGIWRSRFVKN
jgi:uncharacterized repeat protein (TIGR03803 family)